MNKWFKITEGEPEIVDAFCSYGAKDYLMTKSVSGGHGYLPKDFYNKLMSYDDIGLEQFNYKISPNEYRRSYVTKDYKPMYGLSIRYMVKYWSLRLFVRVYNVYINLANKNTDRNTMSYEDAKGLLSQGKTIGIMTHVGGARQWWFKMNSGQLMYGTFANSPDEVKNWKKYKDVLPTFWKYKVGEL